MLEVVENSFMQGKVYHHNGYSWGRCLSSSLNILDSHVELVPTCCNMFDGERSLPWVSTNPDQMVTQGYHKLQTLMIKRTKYLKSEWDELARGWLSSTSDVKMWFRQGKDNCIQGQSCSIIIIIMTCLLTGLDSITMWPLTGRPRV